jgi:hypothetical protein
MFVYELGLHAKNLDEREKIDSLKLTGEEWQRVKVFLDVLGVSCAVVSVLN